VKKKNPDVRTFCGWVWFLAKCMFVRVSRRMGTSRLLVLCVRSARILSLEVYELFVRILNRLIDMVIILLGQVPESWHPSILFDSYLELLLCIGVSLATMVWLFVRLQKCRTQRTSC
jgi:hypothetical protein